MKRRYIQVSALLPLLSLLTLVSSLAVGPQRLPPAFQNTATREKATLAAARQQQRKRRKRKAGSYPQKTPPPPRTPVVDSALLRFVSAQKRARMQQQPRQQVENEQLVQQQQQQQQSPLLWWQQQQTNTKNNNVQQEEEPLPSLGTEPAGDNGGVDFSGFAAYVTSLFSQKEETETTSTSSSNTNVMDDTPVDDPSAGWLRQYNRCAVAKLLSSRLANEANNKAHPSLQASIALAGERVQSQALARTARQRVREFLKQRDQDWSTKSQQQQQNIEEEETSATTNMQAATVAASTVPDSRLRWRNHTNNLEQVVDLLLENGFLVRDVTEILIHSPGVALMQPRPDDEEKGGHVAVQDEQPLDEQADRDEDDDNNNNGETLQETLHRVWDQLLQNTLNLRTADARRVIRDTPGLLTMRGSKSATDMVALLVQLSVSAKSIARQKRELPALLSRAPSAIFRLVAFLASDAVRMPVQQIGPLLRRTGGQELLNQVAPVQRYEQAMLARQQINTLTSNKTNGSDNSTEDRVASLARYDVDVTDEDWLMYDVDETDPGVLSALYGRGSQLRRERINQLYRNMSETAWTLRHEIGTVDLGKVIAAYPSVLLLDAKEQILPAAEYLMTQLGIWEDDLPRVLQLYPALLGRPVEEMKQIEAFLLSLEISSEQLSLIFRSFPVLLTLDVETQMKPVIEFLRNEAGVSNIGRFVSRLPAVLGYSIEKDLQPKWEFLASFSSDPSFGVSRFPAYFSYPLDKVIRPRFLYLQQVKNVPAPLLSSRLDHVLRYGDEDFVRKVAQDRDGGQAFAEFCSDLTKKEKRKQRKRPNRKKR